MGQLVNRSEQELTLWKHTFFCYCPGNRSYLHLLKKLLTSIFVTLYTFEKSPPTIILMLHNILLQYLIFKANILFSLVKLCQKLSCQTQPSFNHSAESQLSTVKQFDCHWFTFHGVSCSGKLWLVPEQYISWEFIPCDRFSHR